MVPIRIGVPQGPINDLLLCVICGNDIDNSCTEKLLSFADDTTLFTSNSNLNELYDNVNLEVNGLYQWFCSNKLSQIHLIET